MRRTERYTVPFPPAEPAPRDRYVERFRQFPFWYRWYLRTVTVFTGSTIDRTVRLHELQELRRRITQVAPSIADCAIPALLPDFQRHLRTIITHRERLRMPIHEVTVNRRGPFLLYVLRHLSPETFTTLDNAATLPADLLESTETTRAVAQEAVRAHLLEEMERQEGEIRRHIEPVWTALRSLYLLARFDLDPIHPPRGSETARVPLRVVRTAMQEFFQLLQMVQLKEHPEALPLAWEYLRDTARMNLASPGGIYHALREFTAAVPMEELVQLAWEDPYLVIPAFSIRSEWWTPLQQTWLTRAADRTASALFEHRLVTLTDMVRDIFLVDRPPDHRLPTELYPTTTGIALLLAGSDLFQDTRRVVTQLVIDAVFHHLDTRNALHQAALQVDQSLERLMALLGDGVERRGTLGEEIQRIRKRAGNASFARRQLVGLFERNRPRIRSAIEDLTESLITAGTLISRTVSRQEGAFEYRTLKLRTVESELPPQELLDLVAHHWQPLGRQLRALYRMESTA